MKGMQVDPAVPAFKYKREKALLIDYGTYANFLEYFASTDFKENNTHRIKANDYVLPTKSLSCFILMSLWDAFF